MLLKCTIFLQGFHMSFSVGERLFSQKLYKNGYAAKLSLFFWWSNHYALNRFFKKAF